MKYVYGVIRTDEAAQFDVKTVGGSGPVKALVKNGLALLISESEGGKIRPSRRNMLAHTMVLEKVMETHDVLPMRFGLLLEDSADGEGMLVKYHDMLSQRLSEIAAHEEYGVRAVWDEKLVFQEILSERVDLMEIRDTLAKKPATETYYERIELGRQLEAAIAARNDHMERRVHPALSELAKDEVLNERKEQMTAMDAAYLVSRENKEAFEALLNEKFNNASDALQVKLVGPVPPFNFVNLSIEWAL